MATFKSWVIAITDFLQVDLETKESGMLIIVSYVLHFIPWCSELILRQFNVELGGGKLNMIYHCNKLVLNSNL